MGSTHTLLQVESFPRPQRPGLAQAAQARAQVPHKWTSTLTNQQKVKLESRHSTEQCVSRSHLCEKNINTVAISKRGTHPPSEQFILCVFHMEIWNCSGATPCKLLHFFLRFARAHTKTRETSLQGENSRIKRQVHLVDDCKGGRKRGPIKRSKVVALLSKRGDGDHPCNIVVRRKLSRNDVDEEPDCVVCPCDMSQPLTVTTPSALPRSR